MTSAPMTTLVTTPTTLRPTRAISDTVSSSGVLPRTGVVLIGTRRSLEHLARQVEMLDEPPVLAGVIFVDDSPARSVRGVSVLGRLDELAMLAPRFNLRLALVSVPSSQSALRARVKHELDAIGLAWRAVPTLEEALGGLAGVTIGMGTEPATVGRSAVGSTGTTSYSPGLPAIDLGALIGRTPHGMDRDAIGRALRGKRVLITGAGGSIGSELARVCAEFDPERLVLMERGENSLFEIDRQLGRQFPKIARKAVLHDVVDAEATLRVAMDVRPHVVFHAAAHKHVPLMEDHPAHAVSNNLFGTKSIADASVAVGAERFVMISSDKAVNPTSVMGATKRLAELYMHGLSREASQRGTRLSMVRFGNVLGSAASVLTIWSQQLIEGGPITITDPRMTRYFMTIPEAATLVVQSSVLETEAGSNARQGTPVGVYVLDMGEPVRIVELAARFVRAHGLTPRLSAQSGSESSILKGDADGSLQRLFVEPEGGWGSVPTIEVACTGARPGEKIHEELAYAAEALKTTAHPGVRAWSGPGFEADKAGRVREMIADLAAARFSPDRHAVLSAIRAHVPEMRPAEPSSPGVDANHPIAG